MCTRNPWLAKRTSSPSCRRTAPRNANSIEAIVAPGLGRLAGDEDLVIMNVVTGGCPDGAMSAATYCPAAKVACAELVPLLACGEKTKAPIPPMLFWAAAGFGSAAIKWARGAAGASRARAGGPCAPLVALE